ncbi:MAG: L-iditol 2-dehydrogenase [Gammaproteobacteria bacterium]|nr:L-iditol 2-dehydrogenase [Gammaproteobacteria bacterium]
MSLPRTPPARRSQRAAVLTGSGRTTVREVALREPSAHEVRIRVEGCGICASNLPVWEGRPWFHYPLAAGTPGHEGWGFVEALGEGVDDLDEGERVAFISGSAYAEFDIAARSAVVRLPDELAKDPFPGEPLGCAMNIFERSDIRAGQRVAIVGSGFLGVLLTQLSARAGAEVVVLSRRPYALDLARKAGAAITLNTCDEAAAKSAALTLTGGRGFERVIEAAGLQSTLDIASALTSEYSRLVIAGYHQDGMRQVNLQEWNWRGLDVVNAHERDPARYTRGMERAISAVLDGRMDPFPLLTHTVPLEALARGFEMTDARPDGFMKAILLVHGRA